MSIFYDRKENSEEGFEHEATNIMPKWKTRSRLEKLVGEEATWNERWPYEENEKELWGEDIWQAT